MSKKAEKPSDKAAEKDKKKGKKKGEDKDGAGQVPGASVANHPRARAAVRRTKGWGGLIGFGIAAYLSVQAGVPLPNAGLRALGAGVIGYIVAWGCAVAVWRHLVMAEMRAAYEHAARRGLTPAAGPRTSTGGSGGNGATGNRR